MIFEAVFLESAKEKALKNAAGRRSSLGDPLRGLLSVQSGRFPGSGERIRKFYRKFTRKSCILSWTFWVKMGIIQCDGHYLYCMSMEFAVNYNERPVPLLTGVDALVSTL